MRLVQHIKRRCSSANFSAHLSGERCLELASASLDIEVGDFITFVEVDSNGDKTGRTITRKVVQADRSTDLGIDRTDVVALGLQAPEFNTLRLAFNRHFLMGIVIECKGDESFKPWGHAQCWPLLISPDLLAAGVLEPLHLDRWPRGVYTVHLSASYGEPKEGSPLELDITDTLILAFCRSQENGDVYEGVEVDLKSLLIGKALSSFDGVLYTPADPEEVRAYFSYTPPKEDKTLTLHSGELDLEGFEQLLKR